MRAIFSARSSRPSAASGTDYKDRLEKAEQELALLRQENKNLRDENMQLLRQQLEQTQVSNSELRTQLQQRDDKTTGKPMPPSQPAQAPATGTGAKLQSQPAHEPAVDQGISHAPAPDAADSSEDESSVAQKSERAQIRQRSRRNYGSNPSSKEASIRASMRSARSTRGKDEGLDINKLLDAATSKAMQSCREDFGDSLFGCSIRVASSRRDTARDDVPLFSERGSPAASFKTQRVRFKDGRPLSPSEEALEKHKAKQLNVGGPAVLRQLSVLAEAGPGPEPPDTNAPAACGLTSLAAAMDERNSGIMF